MEASDISSRLFEQLNFRGEKQKVISSNIANINTPDYKKYDDLHKKAISKYDELDKLKF